MLVSFFGFVQLCYSTWEYEVLSSNPCRVKAEVTITEDNILRVVENGKEVDLSLANAICSKYFADSWVARF
jgi:hypothetical protein